jgi:hypothetical protein
MGKFSLNEMITALRGINDVAWGRYAFKKEMLKNKIPPERQDEMAVKAVLCGEEWAQRMIAQTGASDVETMRETLGLELIENNLDMTSMPQQLFAQFVPDKRVEIMSQPVSIYAGMHEPGFPEPEQVRSLLIAHEMFHYVENQHSKEIYSRTEKILLWKLFEFKWESTVRTIGEIAAMSFAKTLTGADYSPFILDILLLYGYNRDLAENVFCGIMNINAK